MSHNLLALASTANEAALAWRKTVETHDFPLDWRTARELVEAVDALTGAVLEHANEAPIEIPLDDLTRLREVEDVAAHLGKTVPEAIVYLVNGQLSGTFLDGYRAAIEEGATR